MRTLAFISVLLITSTYAQDGDAQRIMQIMGGLNQQAAQAQNQGNYALAEESRRQLISLMESINFPQPQLAQQLSNLASLLNLNGNPEEAQALCERALEILEQFPTNDPVQEAVLQGNLATSLRLQGDFDGARLKYEEELSLLSELGMSDTHFAASATAGIGAIEAELGNLNEAKERYESAIPIFLQISDESHPTTARFIQEYESILERIGD